MVLEGFGINEIEKHPEAVRQAEAIDALITFGMAAEKYKTFTITY